MRFSRTPLIDYQKPSRREDAHNLTTLRPFLQSADVFLTLDNAEIILDSHILDARTLYSAVELSRIRTTPLPVTTRFSITPPTHQQLEVPVLSVAFAGEAFYDIWTDQRRISDIDSLQPLDYHPPSITLLATVAVQTRWNSSRLLRE